MVRNGLRGALAPVAICLFAAALPVEASEVKREPVEIEIRVRQLGFEPNTITVRDGDRVRLVIRSEDGDHRFALDGFDVALEAAKGRDAVAEFTAGKAGRYRFYCAGPCSNGHAAIAGELVVKTEGMQVRFDDSSPGVVIVESGGERIRIDTASRTVARLEEPPAGSTAAEKSPEPHAGAQDNEVNQQAHGEDYDYRLVNVPTGKRVPRGSLSVHFSHRFQKPIHDDGESFGDTARELFGLDSFSVSTLAFTYGFTDRLWGTVHRSPICQPSAICKTIELGLGYRLLDEEGRSPLALTAYGSVEGSDNFSEHFTFNIQAMLARSVTRYADLFFAPAVHLNSNGQGRFNPRPTDFFPPSPLASQLELGQHTGSFGLGLNARFLPTTSFIFEYTPRVGFKMGQIIPVFEGLNLARLENRSEASIGFGVEKRIGRHVFTFTLSNTQATTTSRYNSSNLVFAPSKLIIGFNLYRRLL
jgi:plastocyanin